MITLAQYVGKYATSPDWTPERQWNAERLLEKVNKLEEEMTADGLTWLNNPATGSQVSGETFGGFRPQWCKQGTTHSNHKEGLAVDVYDPHNAIDTWCATHSERLDEHDIWIEISISTLGWAHMQSVPPKSGNRFFYP